MEIHVIKLANIFLLLASTKLELSVKTASYSTTVSEYSNMNSSANQTLLGLPSNYVINTTTTIWGIGSELGHSLSELQEQFAMFKDWLIGRRAGGPHRYTHASMTQP